MDVRLEGHRLAGLHAEGVPMERLVAELEPLLEGWARRREPSGGLGGFHDRWRRDILTGAKGALAARSQSLDVAAS